jgi:glutamate racemase
MRYLTVINILRMKTHILLTFCIGLLLTGCNNPPSTRTTIHFNDSFLNHVLNDPLDYYYIDFKANAKVSSSLPIGMFDSGTGGLTVLRALVDFDQYDNSNQKFLQGGDGINDFRTEQFIYFGDQANMPYGNYSEMNKTGFLKELVLRDALFLLGNKYFKTPDDKMYQTDKQTVKLIIIACNTATAYGKNDIEEMLSSEGSKIKVIGVIDAGVRGALATFKKDESGTVAVLATAGTVSSKGYLNTFNSFKTTLGYTGNIELIQQAGTGIAEAIDGEPNYISRNALKPRMDYKGPSLNDDNLKIQNELMKIYNFDTIRSALLCDFINDQCYTMQLNSPENYVKYYLVSLCEQLRMKHVVKPLKTLILGCTHYSYMSAFIRKGLKELYYLKINGKYIYRDVLCDSIILIDPAINTAKEVYEYLASNNLLNKNGDINKSQFFISVPDNLNVEIKTDSLKRFTYDYKYGRNENHFYDTKQVPVSRLNTNDEIISRLKIQIPTVFELIRKFDTENEKTIFLKPDERF